MKKNTIGLKDIDVFVIDFDGVLTNNKVYLDKSGKEFVSCNRSDGLAFDVLRKLKKPCFILSSETNPVVEARAKKLKVKSFQGVNNKLTGLKEIIKRLNFDSKKVFFIGNDINDYYVMKFCGYSACPQDSHKKIKDIATFKCKSKGGEGILQEILENIFDIDFLKVLYK